MPQPEALTSPSKSLDVCKDIVTAVAVLLTSTWAGGDFADLVTPHSGTGTLGLLSTDTSQEARQRTLPLRGVSGRPQGADGTSGELLPRQDTEHVALS